MRLADDAQLELLVYALAAAGKQQPLAAHQLGMLAALASHLLDHSDEMAAEAQLVEERLALGLCGGSLGGDARPWCGARAERDPRGERGDAQAEQARHSRSLADPSARWGLCVKNETHWCDLACVPAEARKSPCSVARRRGWAKLAPMTSASLPWLILGAGYTGARLAARLCAQGAQVVVTRRSFEDGGELPAAAVRLVLELDAPPATLDASGGIVVWCAPPGQPPGQREAALIGALRGCAHLVYVSSTGVYGPGSGQWVDERWPVAPQGALGAARAEAEAQVARACDQAGISWCTLRAAGIYGPGRGLVERVRAGAARIIEDGAAHVSRVHVKDLVTAIIAAGLCRLSGAVNCADDDPAPHGEVLTEVARRLGLPPPPRIGANELSEAARAMLLADRKICNHRLRHELGVMLRYPSWRVALEEELAGSVAR